ncbi:CPBP family intramembrane glutamic endopeptidase [Streptococcus pluranimalium]
MISFIPLLVTLLVFWGNYFQFQLNFILPFIGTLLVGFGEEFLFRRTLLPYFLKTHSVHKAVIFSALIFVFCHSIGSVAKFSDKSILV